MHSSYVREGTSVKVHSMVVQQYLHNVYVYVTIIIKEEVKKLKGSWKDTGGVGGGMGRMKIMQIQYLWVKSSKIKETKQI